MTLTTSSWSRPSFQVRAADAPGGPRAYVVAGLCPPTGPHGGSWELPRGSPPTSRSCGQRVVCGPGPARPRPTQPACPRRTLHSPVASPQLLGALQCQPQGCSDPRGGPGAPRALSWGPQCPSWPWPPETPVQGWVGVCQLGPGVRRHEVDGGRTGQLCGPDPGPGSGSDPSCGRLACSRPKAGGGGGFQGFP